MNYTWYEMGWIVLIYSFLGWCAEVAFAAVRHGRFVNRGFLNGPSARYTATACCAFC